MLIISTYYILCISWIIKCLIIIDVRCKHEDNIYIVQLANEENNFSIFTYNYSQYERSLVSLTQLIIHKSSLLGNNKNPRSNTKVH